MTQKLQETHQLMRAFVDVEKTVSFQLYGEKGKREKHEKIISFYTGPYTIVEIVSDLNFEVEVKKRGKLLRSIMMD